MNTVILPCHPLIVSDLLLYLDIQLGEGSFELMRTVKKALDPKGLLNPGKIFDSD